MIADRIQLRPKAAPFLHGALGIAKEAGELLTALEKWLWYNQKLDETNIKEELGDIAWYFAEICNALGFDMSEILSANIAKLQKRYPDKYTDEAAKEKNRDRTKEAEVIAISTSSAFDKDYPFDEKNQ